MVKYNKEQKLKLLDDKLTELELNSEKKKELVRRLKNASKGIDLIELLHSFKKYKETLELNDLHFMLSCLETFKNIEIPKEYYSFWYDNILEYLKGIALLKGLEVQLEKDYIFKGRRDYYTQVVIRTLKDNEVQKTVFFNICFCLEYNIQKDPKYTGDYFVSYYQESREAGIRCIQISDYDFWNPRCYLVLVNLLEHSLGLSSKSIFARNTEVKITPANTQEVKDFLDKNNLAGYRPANLAFSLVDKNTKEIYMCYTVGHAHFGNGIYDAEITRGGCKLGHTIVGGASKLWKYIQEYFSTHGRDGKRGSCNSIVYYTDCRTYDSQSLGFLENTIFVKTQSGFCNFWLQDPNYPEDKRYINELKEREPSRHSYICDLTRRGYVLTCYHPGTSVFVWLRPDYNPTEEEDPKWYGLKKFLRSSSKDYSLENLGVK